MTAFSQALEEVICASFAEHGGYTAAKNDKLQGEPRDFDPVRGLDTAELFAFVGATQINPWNELIKRYGGGPNTAQAKFIERLPSELDGEGSSTCCATAWPTSVTLRLAYFRPAYGLTPELVARYDANRLTATASSTTPLKRGKSVDLALSVNDIPVSTAELKKRLTGQGVEHAVTQYRADRDPKNRTSPGWWCTSPSIRSGWP